MSGLVNRTYTGVNVSKYIANLNAIPSEKEMAQSQQMIPSEEDEFAPFLSTDFFDWDLAQTANIGQAVPFDAASKSQRKNSAIGDNVYPDPTTFPNMSIDPSIAPQSAGSNQLFPSAQAELYGSPLSPNSGSPTSSSMKPFSLEEQSRMAAEEDKRRRNTAASARFRVKKKQREQALERSEKELRERNAQLEAKVAQLEMENKWLRGLVTDKAEGLGRDMVSELLASKMKASKESNKRKADDEQSSPTEETTSKKAREEERKDGVGTVKAEA